MKILVWAVLAALSSSVARAEDRVNRPFNTTNGRTVMTTHSAPRVYTVTTPGGGVSTNSGPSATPITAGNTGGQAIFSRTGGRAMVGTVGRSSGRSTRGIQRYGRAFGRAGTRRVDAGGAGAGPAGGVGGGWKTTPTTDGGSTTNTPTTTDPAPPNFSKPGALIRDTGQQPVYQKAEAPQTHTTDAGEIVFNNRKGVDVGRAPSVQQGPKDTPPPPNPVEGAIYNTGAAANSTPTGSSSSGGSVGTTDTSGGHDNNGSGNNDKNMPGDTTDPHGGSHSDSLTDSVNSAY